MMAKQDNPTMYKNATSSDQKALLFKAMNEGLNDTLAADIFHLEKPDSYIYDPNSEKKGIFYVLNEFNIWEKDSEACDLKYDLMRAMPELIEKMYFDYTKNTELSLEDKSRLAKIHSKNIKYLSMSKTRTGYPNQKN